MIGEVDSKYKEAFIRMVEKKKHRENRNFLAIWVKKLFLFIYMNEKHINS